MKIMYRYIWYVWMKYIPYLQLEIIFLLYTIVVSTEMKNRAIFIYT